MHSKLTADMLLNVRAMVLDEAADEFLSGIDLEDASAETIYTLKTVEMLRSYSNTLLRNHTAILEGKIINLTGELADEQMSRE